MTEQNMAGYSGSVLICETMSRKWYDCNELHRVSVLSGLVSTTLTAMSSSFLRRCDGPLGERHPWAACSKMGDDMNV